MKKIILAAVLGICSSTFIQAQEIPERKTEPFTPMTSHHGQGRHHMKADMSALNLSSEQQDKLQSMRKEQQQKLSDLQKMDNITVKEYRERMQGLRKEQHEKMQSLLTAEQKDQLKKNREEHKAGMEQMQKKRGEKMKAMLNLTDDQSARMEKNRADMVEKMKAIRENQSYTDMERREKMKEAIKAQHENLRSILTEEQLQKMKEHKRESPKHKINDAGKTGTI